MGVRRNFSRGGNVNILLTLFRLQAIQYQCTFNNTLPFLHYKESAHVTATIKKGALLTAITRYITITHTRLFADFQSRVLLFEEALPWSLTKEALSWSLTKEALPWSLTKEALPWSLTKEALPWSLTKEALPRSLTKEALPRSLTKEALPRSLTRPQIMTSFYLARLVIATSKQELQTPGFTSKAINYPFNKTLFVFANFFTVNAHHA